ncbi:MAG: M24 family metallopeptidase [Bacteroidota bacterium]
MLKSTLFTLLLCFSFGLYAQMPAILTLEEEARLKDEWLEKRVQHILPQIMQREGIDMWLLISREYNEDPVLKTFLPSGWLSARRTTMLVIYDTGDGLETLACARYNVGSLFQKAWDKETQPDQWAALAGLIAERDPQRIAINRSEHFGLADGLSSYHYEKLLENLPEQYSKRLIDGERLAIGWLESRLPEEMVAYRQVMRIAHQIIAEGLSEKVITPGVTSTAEVGWWYRERIRELGFKAWFHPIVDVQRADPANTESQRNFSGRPAEAIIQPGDLIHIDLGITYLGLNTDTQQNAYVLKPGETAPPDYLVAAHQKGLRVMDILTSHYKTGRTGNEILIGALDQAKAEGLEATIYTHPIGYHGHGAGPTIGLWDQQGGVPHKGDYPLYPNTAYSIELNNAIFLPEWNKRIRIMLEEDAFFDGENCRYIDGRQKELYLIPRLFNKHGE